jgi:hypothetical protein
LENVFSSKNVQTGIEKVNGLAHTLQSPQVLVHNGRNEIDHMPVVDKLMPAKPITFALLVFMSFTENLRYLSNTTLYFVCVCENVVDSACL